MLTCINKNSAEYQTLMERSGISDFILESICRDFLEKYDRFPYLDEIIGSNSEPYIRKSLQLDSYNSTNIDNILSITGASTIELANISLNDLYRDVEVEITPLNKDAIVETTKRPTEDNFNNWTEEDEILSKAPRNSEGQLLAPNGKPSNLTEKQYAQVRTKAFKRWFGNWEKTTKENPYSKNITIGPPEADFSNVDAAGTGVLIPIYLNNKYIGETGLDNALYNKNEGMSIKGEYMDMPSVGGSNITIEEEYRGKGYGKAAYFELAKLAANNGKILRSASDKSRTPASTRVWESLVRDGYAKRVNNRYEFINSTLYEASKVVDENGEPLVVYHGSKNGNFDTFDDNYLRKTDSGFFFTSDKEYAKQFGNTREFFLNIKNPNLINVPLNIDTVETLLTVDYVRGTDGIQGHDDTNTNENLSKSKGLEYVVIRPNQIKSATDNSGLFNRQNNNIYDPEPNGYLVFTNALNKLASLYGIKFNDITDAELNSEEWKSIIPDINSVNAFVYNGQIYINIDKANLDAPIHEMMHILVGSIRFLNPSLYTDLINLSEQFPNYHKLVLKFPGRTRNDVNEEIFIEEVSKYLSGLPSNIANITPKLLYEISYNVKRLLDTILMGQDSVKTLSNDRLFSLSLKELALEVNSSIMKNNFHGTINVENSELHRKLNNIKSDLYNLGTLKEYCD